MKNILLSLVAAVVLFAGNAKAQSPGTFAWDSGAQGYLTTVTGDTNSATLTNLFANNVWDPSTMVAWVYPSDSCKIVLQGSLDGTNWGTISTSDTLTAMTRISYSNVDAKYLRFDVQGTGTYAATETCKIMLHLQKQQ